MLRSTATLPAGTLRNTFTGVTGSTAAISAANQFTTKTYVDSALGGIIIPDPDLTPYLLKSGGTMTGALVLPAAPTQDLEASTKKYVDDKFAAVPPPDLTSYLPKAGGTMTGDLILRGDPVEDLEASTKKYVDDRMEHVTGLVDKNQTDGGLYKLDIENNAVNFYRGDGTDKFLEVYGGFNDLNATVTIQGNRDIMRFPVLGQTLNKSEWLFSSGSEIANGSPYTSNGVFRLICGNTGGKAFT